MVSDEDSAAPFAFTHPALPERPAAAVRAPQCATAKSGGRDCAGVRARRSGNLALNAPRTLRLVALVPAW